jgi:hypothetical protein
VAASRPASRHVARKGPTKKAERKQQLAYSGLAAPWRSVKISDMAPRRYRYDPPCCWTRSSSRRRTRRFCEQLGNGVPSRDGESYSAPALGRPRPSRAGTVRIHRLPMIDDRHHERPAIGSPRTRFSIVIVTHRALLGEARGRLAIGPVSPPGRSAPTTGTLARRVRDLAGDPRQLSGLARHIPLD